MRLSDFTDYSLRVLMCCASDPARRFTIAALAENLHVSKNHLMKVVNDLARQGLLETTRGRGGGLRLLKPASEIRIGDVVRRSETDFRLVECFDPAVNSCTLTPGCGLKRVLGQALQAYLAVLDASTLAELVGRPPGLPAAVPRLGPAQGTAGVEVALPPTRRRSVR